jgi:hypothetical protein
MINDPLVVFSAAVLTAWSALFVDRGATRGFLAVSAIGFQVVGWILLAHKYGLNQ